ncbi:hypothetical protein O6H91_22G051400 [Diphasiastrum complanatum]|uniref:Uncharacterized protein n=1 Tax=Diphasiastrum complanatum TaxID=34168 RepID=A0ACC2AFF0_DIPCM|nr:hypothetical protein O6H91_22G051400 [Diphasiastrum complanatum]
MKMSDEVCHPLIQSLIDLVSEIGRIGDYRNFSVKDSANLTRRVKLLSPLFEELRETKFPVPNEAALSLQELKNALQAAKKLLQECHDGSKLHLVLDRDGIADKFFVVTAQLGQALDFLPYNHLDLSDEVREQVELVHAQLKRAKSRLDTPDLEIYLDAMAILSQKDDKETDRAVLERISKKLHLRTASELKKESRAVQNLILDKGGQFDETMEQISFVLRKLKAFAAVDSTEADSLDFEKARITSGAGPENSNSPNIPDDFRCPISLELMKDPVIVATGQTYERACIQKWLDAGHKTCPKTQQVLPHLVLTPNYVLRSLIGQWCETHGIEVPKMFCSNSAGKGCAISSQLHSGDRATIDALLRKLFSGEVDVQRAAAGELRMLAKRSIENRICIAEAGAIPFLVSLLTSKDLKTQEHAVTALLNLSIHDQNKSHIILAGAVDPIVEVLKSGSMEARENAAATLFSLSVVDENKVTIGASGAIPALVELLSHGTSRGKKDAATALFNLSIYQGNKVRAVRAGVVPPLMQLLVDLSVGMVDEALTLLAILASNQEGRAAIGSTSPVPILVDLIRFGSARNKENAAAILLALCINDSGHIFAARQFRALVPLAELARTGTTRARRKATNLLELLRRKEQVAERPS